MLGREPELTRYETPIKGLYLTGAATYPGAGVWGAAGRNTATVILRGIAGSLGGFGSRRPDRATRISLGQAMGSWVLQGKSIQRSVSRQTYSHFTTERGFS